METSSPTTTGVARRIRAAVRPRSALTALAALAVLTAVVLVGGELDRHLGSAEARVAALGPWGPLAFIALFVVAASVLVPDTILCVAAGVLFGLWPGTATVLAGSLLAGALQHGLARRLLRPWIERWLDARPRFRMLQRAMFAGGIRLQVLLRLAPLNPATVSYLLGAAGVGLPGFLLACLALTPHLFLEVYVGHAGAHLVRLAGGGNRPTLSHDLVLAAGLGLAGLAVILASRSAKRAIATAVEQVGAIEDAEVSES